MPRSEARVFTSIWKDEDFIALPATAQRLYLFLLSQEDLTLCGVIPLRVPRWARKALGLAVQQVDADLELLASGPRPFTVIDEETGELLVRSLIRNDQVWKIPNVMKGARESAALIESRMIRAVLLNELLRIPVHESTSRLVKEIHEGFIQDLRKGSGNPSPNPSGNRRPNPSDNASADRSQGKGDGCTPVPQASPPPGSPSPRAAPSDVMRPLWPSAVPAASPEGGEGPEQDQDLDVLVAEIRAIRPDWPTRSIKRALADPAVAERPPELVRAAALAVARDPASQQPGRLGHDGPWWAQAAAQLGTAEARPRPPWCGKCDERTRQREKDDGRPARCPDCHPSLRKEPA